MMQRCLGAALLALAFAGASDASAASMEKVDCSRLSFTIATVSDADWTECYRLHHSEANSGEGADGPQADFQAIVADVKTHVLHIDTGKAGKGSYFHKDSIESMLKEFDELEKLGELSEEPEFGNYELVRFQASLWKASTDCVGFLKYGRAPITQGGSAPGASSYIVGYDCWRNGVPDRAAIEALLKSIKFP